MNVTCFPRPLYSPRLRSRWPFVAAFAATLLLISSATAAPLFVKSGGDPVPDSADRRYFLVDPPLWRMETLPAPELRRARLEGYGALPKSEIRAQVMAA